MEIVAQGHQEQLGQFIEWCKKGPPAAAVDHVEIKKEKSDEEYSEFRILF